MSQENVAVVEAALNTFARDGLDAFAAEYWTDDIDHRAIGCARRPGSDGLPLARTQWESLPGARQEIDRLHDRGDEIISVGRVSRLMPGSDARIGNPILLSWKIRDGRVTRLEVLGAGSEFHKALEAAGLQE